ncbi:GyrI-like domain-containing protein [Corynebacterium epidermidicanis]|uniref:Transcriptional regulator, effector-binding domain/component n=1 Tax=Corynebacterium epidermidicanis TaxID=1050174 RepID=A0A0G3GVC5_9CORY|nr:GyrI-like domain-containing protein [Corynebacterium epidermidicanis]AKK03493.1 transcriptional regulator, effector-binding domain/component [Corynebacterium epidermidicanis]
MSFVTSAPATSMRRVQLPETHFAVVRAFDVSLGDIGQLFDSAFPACARAFATGILVPDGPAICRYLRIDAETDNCDLEIGFPVASALSQPVQLDGQEFVPSCTPAAEYAMQTYFGFYDGLNQAWSAFVSTMAANGLQPAGPCLECYVTEPAPDLDPATMRTDLYCPVESIAD